MATYFHHNTADIQQGHDGLHTLVLMNPSYVQYSTDAPPPQPPQTNLLFLNSAATTSISPSTLLHAPPPHPHHQQFVGIPLPSTASASPDPNSPSIHHAPQHDLSSMHGLIPRAHYNVWNTLDPSVAAREASRSQGGLSLSLSSQQPGFGSFRNEREAPHAPHAPPQDTGHDVPISGESPSSASGVTNGVSGVQSVQLSSKYLKAAQELLDEVVNVGSGIKAVEAALKRPSNYNNGLGKAAATDGGSSAAKEDESSGGGRKSGGELTTAERQEIQMKKAKLINMLDEVEQRYRQYHHQMQIVISTFEQVAGIGSARTYTALALQTISKQFRYLKDAITGQIRSANKSLGEEDSPGGKLEGSRLKFVDHHIRQQRALQQLGMIQHNAWRPQRGLPERSVSILRAWLFEHFLHPYPKDSDKHLLAKQTGLTRSQVSNWFINARVRLWKPMVEEMYLEEVKEQGLNHGGDDKPSKSEYNEDSTSKSSGPPDNAPSKNHVKAFKENSSINQEAPVLSPHSTASVGGNVRNQSGFALIGSTELDGIKQGSPKRRRNIDMLHTPNNFTSMNVETNQAGETNNDQVSLKFADDRRNRDEYSIVGGPANFIGGLGQYPIAEIGRFGAEQFAPTFPGNSVSLTLGLPHSDNLSLSGPPQNFLPSQNIQLGRRVDMGDANEFGAINTAIPHSSTAYDGIDIQSRKRFAAQLLPDFVA